MSLTTQWCSTGRHFTAVTQALQTPAVVSRKSEIMWKISASVLLNMFINGDDVWIPLSNRDYDSYANPI